MLKKNIGILLLSFSTVSFANDNYVAYCPTGSKCIKGDPSKTPDGKKVDEYSIDVGIKPNGTKDIFLQCVNPDKTTSPPIGAHVECSSKFVKCGIDGTNNEDNNYIETKIHCHNKDEDKRHLTIKSIDCTETASQGLDTTIQHDDCHNWDN